MSNAAVLKFKKRITKTSSSKRELQRQGYLLGNVLSKGTDSVSIAVKKDEFRKVLNKFGRNAIINLESSDDETYTVMVKDIQLTPIINEYYHIDFQVVSLTQEMKTDVSINIIGLESLESRRLILNRHLDVVSVVGLPQDIPDMIDVDVSSLEVGDQITINDLTFNKVTPEVEGDTPVASASEPRIETETTEDQEETVESSIEL
jgi:large subunit ribosomal protein L25